MTAVKETHGLMTIGAYAEALYFGQANFNPAEPCKGFMTIALKKGATELSKKTINIGQLAASQPVCKLAQGAEGAAGDDSATLLSWLLPASSPEYTIEVTVAGKVNFHMANGFLNLGQYVGNGQASLTITSGVTDPNGGG